MKRGVQMLSLAVLSLLFVCGVRSQDLQDGKCPGAPNTVDYDVRKLGGVWYETERILTNSEDNRACDVFYIEPASGSDVKIFFSAKNLRTGFEEEGHGQIPDSRGKAGSFDLKFGSEESKKIKFYLVDTDYNFYAILWSCQELASGQHSEMTSLLARTVRIPLLFKVRLYRHLKNLGVETADFRTVHQTNCRRDHFNLNHNISGSSESRLVKRYATTSEDKSDPPIKITEVSFEELSALINASDVTLIDVRTPEELKEVGMIPTSVNVPLAEVEQAFQLPSNEFKEKYGFPLPSKDDGNVVMTCRSGRRATDAIIIVRKFGYDKSAVKVGERDEIKYDELSNLMKSGQVTLVDVREPSELQTDGKIPGSINVPVSQVEKALQLPPAAFKANYDRSLPDKTDDKIVFHCRAGMRACQATEVARKLGFTSARVYKGSFQDWQANGGKIEKQ
ncbi:uncharacterized protein LOC106472554 [Limulus polyphemus]|uniref:Uncharacterized protein LOC106472554 n=1 Tax=Limulus polyphemus TaxID=6850 RepID=A0ABM1BU28_LIMPO|nr:uncharacterized protein LOC106472554 [Limulus polyphemus]